MACQKSAPTMLRHHSFAKSLVQEKEKDLKEEGRLQLPHFAIRLRHTCQVLLESPNEFKIGKIGGI